MMDCPNCGELLTPITIAVSGGGKISVDHCGSCGGTWFDNYEINRISYQDVFKIASATAIKKREVPWGKLDRLCPRDFHHLEKFKTNITDENLNIERCPHCHGLFLLQKDLEKFKNTQTAKINIFKNISLPFPSLAAVFIPVFFVGLLLFSTFLTVTNLRDAKESQTQALEQIAAVTAIPVTSTSESILFLTRSPTLTQITYQSNIFDSKTIMVDQISQSSHKVNLDRLKPGTSYHFHIIIVLSNGTKALSKEYSFATGK